jgi:CRP/FNR family transcriptional regulator, cyclic AMP receptor protein
MRRGDVHPEGTREADGNVTRRTGSRCRYPPRRRVLRQGALAGQRRRTCTAETLTARTIATVKTTELRRGLRTDVALANRFRSHMLARGIRSGAELIGQLFNRCEKRLARVLLLLAHFDGHQLPRAALPIISRTLLAEVIGTPRWKVDLLMNNFRKLGFLERHSERDGGVQVHRSMLSVVLQDQGHVSGIAKYRCRLCTPTARLAGVVAVTP